MMVGMAGVLGVVCLDCAARARLRVKSRARMLHLEVVAGF